MDSYTDTQKIEIMRVKIEKTFERRGRAARAGLEQEPGIDWVKALKKLGDALPGSGMGVVDLAT